MLVPVALEKNPCLGPASTKNTVNRFEFLMCFNNGFNKRLAEIIPTNLLMNYTAGNITVLVLLYDYFINFLKFMINPVKGFINLQEWNIVSTAAAINYIGITYLSIQKHNVKTRFDFVGLDFTILLFLSNQLDQCINWIIIAIVLLYGTVSFRIQSIIL